MPLAEGGLSGLCFSALGAVVEKALRAPPLHNFWALRPMAEGALSEREAPDILSECHPLAAALGVPPRPQQNQSKKRAQSTVCQTPGSN